MSTKETCVPYLRRRNTPAQLCALQKLFEATQNPTRAQRQALAIEIGMELKSVTNWFQNRRQTSKKKSLSSSENRSARTCLSPSPTHQRYRRSKTPFDRSKISLDRIATLSERPSLTLQSDPHRPALTPRKGNVQHKDPSSPSELWTHMLSSPTALPSAPDPEEVRLAALSSAKISCSLEWACFRARQNKWNDEHPTSGHCQGLESEALSPSRDASGKNLLFSRPNVTPQFEDVEAAITLLGFKTHA